MTCINQQNQVLLEGCNVVYACWNSILQWASCAISRKNFFAQNVGEFKSSEK